MTGIKPKVLLSFDVEEFDIPVEFGQAVPFETQMKVGAAGTERVLDLLDRHGVKATMFTTARFAIERPELARRMAKRHEIASHAFNHSTFEEGDLRASREKLEEITQTPVVGFRRPRLAETDRRKIAEAGYRYNSSENPIWLPGRYNNLMKPRRPYKTGSLLNVPISATPMIRFPLFWLSFKVVPVPVLKALTAWTLKYDGVVNLFFHPWEFMDLREYPAIPGYIRRIDNDRMLARLDGFVGWLKGKGEFVTFSDWMREGSGV
jgi:hypothetical protein